MKTPRKKTSIHKLSETYRLDNGVYHIFAEVFLGTEKRITINTHHDNREIMFKKSKGEVIKAIGELLIEASKL